MLHPRMIRETYWRTLIWPDDDASIVETPSYVILDLACCVQLIEECDGVICGGG